MSDLFDYLRWRGDIRFDQLPVNPVDSLVFSVLSYIDFSGIVPDHPGETISLAEAAQKFATVNAKSSAFYKDIGINKIIFGVNDKEILENFADRNLKEIFDYDKKYKTDYAKILYCYLLCDCSVMSVAEQYGLNRNPVNSKIKAIKEIFNIKLPGSKKMELLLAYTIKNNFDKLGGGD